MTFEYVTNAFVIFDIFKNHFTVQAARITMQLEYCTLRHHSPKYLQKLCGFFPNKEDFEIFHKIWMVLSRKSK